MKITLLLLFALFSNTLFAQTLKEINESLEKKDLSQFKHLIENFKPSDYCAAPDEITNREILRTYHEVVANILIFVPTSKGKTSGHCNYYQINLLAKNNRIIKYDLYSKKPRDPKIENYKLLNHYSNDGEIKTFQEIYEKTFYRKLKLNELFDNSVTYGEHCGFAGINPAERDLLELYINSKNREQLFYWLTSPNFEKKLYGYEGFRSLINKGYKLNEKENTIISGLEYFKGRVNTCRGCIFMSENFSEILKQINE